MPVLSVLVIVLVAQTAPGSQTPAPPAPNTLSPGARPPAETTPVEKKRLGPAAGTPGRATILIIAADADGRVADSAATRAVVAQAQEYLKQQGVTVIEPRQAEIVLAEQGFSLRGQSVESVTNAMKLLNVDAVIVAAVASEEVRRSGFGGLAGIRPRPIETRTRVQLRLVGADGVVHSASSAERTGTPNGLNSKVLESLKQQQAAEATTESLNELLANVVLAGEPSK